MNIKKILIWALIVIGALFILLVLFGENDKISVTDYDYTVKQPVVQKGNRLLGIAVTEGSVGFDKAFSTAQDVGIEFIEFPWQWDDLEKTPEKYENQYLDIANIYYPSQNTRVALTINPIDTTNLRLPKDLKNKTFDDPEVIKRYNKLIDYVFSKIPNLDIVSLSIGNEIDIYLGTDKEKWGQYQRFFEATSTYVKTNYPGIKVGTKATFGGITKTNKEELKALNKHNDIIMITYYPINSDFGVKEPSIVHSDFNEITSIYESKTIHISEAGYPSSTYLGGSEIKQAEFVREIFKAWDEHDSQIQLIDFIWLHEISQSELNYFSEYYGSSDRAFIEFLGTLGLRTSDGKDKPAFVALKKEAEARGW